MNFPVPQGVHNQGNGVAFLLPVALSSFFAVKLETAVDSGVSASREMKRITMYAVFLAGSHTAVLLNGLVEKKVIKFHFSDMHT